MRALVQRALNAAVLIDGEVISSFNGRGLVALIGITHDDDAATARRLAAKLFQLRIFTTDENSGEFSAEELQLPLLVISQFTLYADTSKGRRPSWNAAAPGEIAEPIFDICLQELRSLGAVVGTGRFGAEMQVQLTNDGPVTILLELDPQLPR
ncbi:MAG: D-aminoacyl-tRNA deacylase [Actinomycetota bacterium]|nr:D-aminoacyl-tRNA deacylase [Actinomycetota bacterium]MDP2287028.1 D-aminoacyl-tRNA deacylase [Actinomycetota bacterium]